MYCWVISRGTGGKTIAYKSSDEWAFIGTATRITHNQFLEEWLIESWINS